MATTSHPDLTPPSHPDVGGLEREVTFPLPENQSLTLRFCWCPPGSFLMGSPASEAGRYDDEGPQQQFSFSQGFWLAKHLITQAQWLAVMGSNPGQRSKPLDCPVDTVSRDESKAFCAKLGLCLPTEPQWEYACRAGTESSVALGGGDYLNTQLANFDGDVPYGSGSQAFKWANRQALLPGGSFPANAWGLHDMHGQLWEWCADVKQPYAGKAMQDPQAIEGSGHRVLRGGGGRHFGGFARAALRYRTGPGYRNDFIGCRPSSTQPRRPEAAELRSSMAERARDERA